MYISRKRICVEGEPTPTIFSALSNRRKSLVVYHKTFRFLYPKTKGVRVVLPPCVVGVIRTTYPDSEKEYDSEEDVQSTI